MKQLISVDSLSAIHRKPHEKVNGRNLQSADRIKTVQDQKRFLLTNRTHLESNFKTIQTHYDAQTIRLATANSLQTTDFPLTASASYVHPCRKTTKTLKIRLLLLRKSNKKQKKPLPCLL